MTGDDDDEDVNDDDDNYAKHYLNFYVLQMDDLFMNGFAGMLMSPQPDLLPDVLCLMVRIFRLILVLFYIYKQY